MILKDWLEQASLRLQNAGVSNFIQESYWLAEGFLKLNKAQIFLQKHHLLSQEQINLLNEALQKREARIPLQYLLHQVEFLSLSFHVNQNALIPRPETEELVKWALQNLKQNANVLEIGTGSGCISIALKHFRPDLNITAVDISPKALLVAEINMQELLGANNIKLLLSDLFNQVSDHNFDAILSNPPYLSETDMELIEPELRYEPNFALSCGGDGLDIYRKIAMQANDYLNPAGLVALEIGLNQTPAIKNIFQNYLFMNSIYDHQGISRVLVFKKT